MKSKIKKRQCKNCQHSFSVRVGRGLCRSCWNIPSIRAAYSPVRSFPCKGQKTPKSSNGLVLLSKAIEATVYFGEVAGQIGGDDFKKAEEEKLDAIERLRKYIVKLEQGLLSRGFNNLTEPNHAAD